MQEILTLNWTFIVICFCYCKEKYTTVSSLNKILLFVIVKKINFKLNDFPEVGDKHKLGLRLNFSH